MNPSPVACDGVVDFIQCCGVEKIGNIMFTGSVLLISHQKAVVFYQGLYHEKPPLLFFQPSRNKPVRVKDVLPWDDSAG